MVFDCSLHQQGGSRMLCCSMVVKRRKRGHLACMRLPSGWLLDCMQGCAACSEAMPIAGRSTVSISRSGTCVQSGPQWLPDLHTGRPQHKALLLRRCRSAFTASTAASNNSTAPLQLAQLQICSIGSVSTKRSPCAASEKTPPHPRMHHSAPSHAPLGHSRHQDQPTQVHLRITSALVHPCPPFQAAVST